MNENTIKKVIYVKLGKQNIIVQRKIIHKPWTFQWRIQDFPEEGAPTYDFAKFSQKLHEIERIWTRGGASKILLCRSATAFSPDLFSLCLTHASSKFSKFVYPLLGISLLGVNFKGNQIMNESI